MSSLSLLFLYFLIAWIVTFFVIPPYIRFLQRNHFGKKIREEWLMGRADEFARLHANKAGTPSMGAWIILIVIFLLITWSIVIQKFSKELWLDINYSLWNRNETYLPLFTLFTVGGIWLIDDYLNIHEIWRTKWLSARVKLISLFFFSALWAWWFYGKLGHTGLSLPYFWKIFLGWFYIPLFMLIVVTMANSVNITDGLDGLAGWLLLMNYGLYAYISYYHGLTILAALCIIIAGTLLAFLWYNIKPAQFYMGDIGSLSLGATLAIMAMMTDTLIILAITSTPFWLELLSVIVQMTSKKLRNGKKIFRIAPFHHHLEAIGWSEETIVMRFWIIEIVLVAIGGVVSQLL